MQKELTPNVRVEQTMSSKEIAELTGKEHIDIIRDCERLNEQYSKLALKESMIGVDTSKDVEYERYKRKQYKYLKESIVDVIHNFFNDSIKKYPKIKKGYYKIGDQIHIEYYLTKVQIYDLLIDYPRELRIKLIKHLEDLDEKRVSKSQPTEKEKELLKERLLKAEARLLEAKKNILEEISNPIHKEILMSKFFPEEIVRNNYN